MRKLLRIFLMVNSQQFLTYLLGFPKAKNVFRYVNGLWFDKKYVCYLFCMFMHLYLILAYDGAAFSNLYIPEWPYNSYFCVMSILICFK